jgi:hypothetical protein
VGIYDSRRIDEFNVMGRILEAEFNIGFEV